MLGMNTAHLASFSRSAFVPFARFSLFVIYFWFGVLKIAGVSPASELVQQLFDKTMSFVMPFDTFFVLFSVFEILIGLLILFPQLTRLAVSLIFLHMFSTTLPLVMLPHVVWQAPFVPTLEGQYIIKNLLIIACALGIAAGPSPRRSGLRPREGGQRSARPASLT